jgi:hypothetical protein
MDARNEQWTREKLMVDIILAEHSGNAWLVRGERYIDDLLANTLPPDTSMEIMTCESQSDVNALWHQEDGGTGGDRLPWLIHPGIVNRIRRTRTGHSVFFGQWSALLNDDAHAVLRSAAAAAEASGDATVLLISYLGRNESKPMTDLTSLRCSLIEAELTVLGVAQTRIVREARDAESDPHAAAGSERLDILVKAV